MYHTGEIRWYLQGGLPAEARAWFGVGDLGRQEATRTDQYLALPGCETTGVKIREGRLEVKALVASGGTGRYPNGVTGSRETWVKWSCEAADRETLRHLITDSDDDWIFVRKSRFLRRFEWSRGGLEEVDAAQAPPIPGCHIELTTIRAVVGKQGRGPIPGGAWDRAAPWWSLSLEAFGEPGSLLEDVDRAAGDFFREPPPIDLVEGCSYSYPTWLARLYAAGRAS